MRSENRLLVLTACAAGMLALCLTGCPARPHGPSDSAVGTAVGPSGASGAPGSPLGQRHEGRPFEVAPRESLLTILAFRGGALAKVGHNHVIASHDLTGTVYMPDDPSHATFELHLPVEQMTIDEPELRAKEGPEFPTDVPDSAKEGTRRNMLSEALLNGAQYPEITLVSQHIETLPGSSQVRADVFITVRGQTHTVSVPVSYSLNNDDLTIIGDLPLKQSDLGLTPFTAMLGALAVQDELHVRLHVLARAAVTRRN